MNKVIIFFIGLLILVSFSSYQNRGIEQGAIDLKNQDNDALSRYCEMLEQKIAQLANMQDKKVILE